MESILFDILDYMRARQEELKSRGLEQGKPIVKRTANKDHWYLVTKKDWRAIDVSQVGAYEQRHQRYKTYTKIQTWINFMERTMPKKAKKNVMRMAIAQDEQGRDIAA